MHVFVCVCVCVCVCGRVSIYVFILFHRRDFSDISIKGLCLRVKSIQKKNIQTGNGANECQLNLQIDAHSLPLSPLSLNK